jgi:hypothetical protein
MTTTCTTCRYAVQESDRLACHRNPPPWPTVYHHNWCGEWAPYQPPPQPQPC